MTSVKTSLLLFSWMETLKSEKEDNGQWWFIRIDFILQLISWKYLVKKSSIDTKRKKIKFDTCWSTPKRKFNKGFGTSKKHTKNLSIIINWALSLISILAQIMTKKYNLACFMKTRNKFSKIFNLVFCHPKIILLLRIFSCTLYLI